MCNKTQKLVGNIPNHILRPSYKAILKEFLSYGDWKTGEGIRPSLSTISKSTGYCLRTVKRAKAEFIRLGIFKKKKKHCMLTCRAEELALNFEVVNILLKLPVEKHGIKPKSSDKEPLESSDRSSPNNIINIITNTVGVSDFVDNSPIDEPGNEIQMIENRKAVVLFLLDCKRQGMNIGDKLERFRGLVPEEYFLEELAA